MLSYRFCKQGKLRSDLQEAGEAPRAKLTLPPRAGPDLTPTPKTPQMSSPQKVPPRPVLQSIAPVQVGPPPIRKDCLASSKELSLC